MAWFIIIISIGIAVGMIAYWKNKQSQVIASGDAIARNGDFVLQKHLFTTSVSELSKIGDTINQEILRNHKITYEPDYASGKIVFHNGAFGGSFGAAFRDFGQTEDGKHQYQFQVEAWEGGDKPSYNDHIAANVLLTEIERTLLKLDENAKISRTYAKYKTKPKWF